MCPCEACKWSRESRRARRQEKVMLLEHQLHKTTRELIQARLDLVAAQKVEPSAFFADRGEWKGHPHG